MSKAKSKPGRKKEPKKEVKEAKLEVKKRQVVRPQGSTPFASVRSRHGSVMIARRGKGFSFGELAGASLPIRLAGPWKVPLDSRRRSVLEENVVLLRKWYTAPSEVAKESRVEAAPVLSAPAPEKSPKTPKTPKKRAAKKKKPKK